MTGLISFLFSSSWSFITVIEGGHDRSTQEGLLNCCARSRQRRWHNVIIISASLARLDSWWLQVSSAFFVSFTYQTILCCNCQHLEGSFLVCFRGRENHTRGTCSLVKALYGHCHVVFFPHYRQLSFFLYHEHNDGRVESCFLSQKMCVCVGGGGDEQLQTTEK